MTLNNRIGRFGLTAALMLAAAGCANKGGIFGVDRYADVPPGAIPEEAGAKLHAWRSRQISNAAADLFALYVSDFVGDTAELSPAARERIGRLVQSNSAQNLSWIVEPSGNPAIDQARVDALVAEVGDRGVTSIDVSIATPPALGLSGPQAEQVAGGAGLNRNAPSNNTLRGAGRFVGGNNFGGAVGLFP